MNILCIETSARVCSAALCCDGVPVAEYTDGESGNHAKMLPLFVRDLLDEASRRDLPLEAVALSEGPGSYTGLRIGASTAKGLCYGLGIPLIPLSTLLVTAAAVAAKTDVQDVLLLPMLDARRMEVYTAPVTADGGQLRLAGEVTARVVENAGWLPPEGTILFFGDGAAKCRTLLESGRVHYLDGVLPNARYMGALAEQAYRADGFAAPDIAYFEPFYLKEFIAAPAHVKGLQ